MKSLKPKRVAFTIDLLGDMVKNGNLIHAKVASGINPEDEVTSWSIFRDELHVYYNHATNETPLTKVVIKDKGAKQ